MTNKIVERGGTGAIAVIIAVIFSHWGTPAFSQPVSILKGSAHPTRAIERDSASAYHIPFGSAGNNIELTIANAFPGVVSELETSIEAIPPWLHVRPEKAVLGLLKAKGESLVKFGFSVDDEAPVAKEQSLMLVAKTPGGGSWRKEIRLIVDPAQRFELRQNYPNPFNPATTISYILPRPARVSCEIYSVLGQEVAHPVDDLQERGFHAVTWDASDRASGVYFLRLSARDEAGRILFQEKQKLLLVR